MTLLDRARTFAEDLVALRRDLHRHPELGFREERTAGVIAERLRALGLTPRTGVAGTGIVADLENGDGPTVALRADMDALPITERAVHGYPSTVPGRMHACGHDAHMTGLVGAARLLAEANASGELPPGRVRLLFQPSEEGEGEDGRSGARRMMDEGALDGVDAITGLHVWAPFPAGTVYLGGGPVMGGAQELRIVVRGKNAHAALPHRGIDAIVLAAQGIGAVQTAVSRRIGPREEGVVSLGRIEGGTAHNVVADRVTIDGTVRWFDDDVHRRLMETIRGAFGGLEAQGATVEIEIAPGYPPVVNDPGVTATLEAAFRGLLGDAVRPFEPMLAGEDFAFFTRRVPGSFFLLGAAPPDGPREHHTPDFDIDESVLPTGAALLALGAIELLKHHG